MTRLHFPAPAWMGCMVLYYSRPITEERPRRAPRPCGHTAGASSGREDAYMVRRGIWLVLAIMLASATHAFAQSVAVAQLTGTVIDESGGALPGADVTVTKTDTGMTRSAVTGPNGGFTFTNLPVGPYKLTTKMSGFSTFEQTGIVLAVGSTGTVNVTMKIGGQTETVTVEADAIQVETRSVGMGTVVPQEQIVGLPLNGRSALQLILL